MSLTPKERQQLKAKAHRLKPIVFVGQQGLSENVMTEIDRALTDHELIKIRVVADDRDEKRDMFAAICETHQAEAVQLIGNMATLYRKKKE